MRYGGKYLDVNSVLPESKSIRWISVAAISPDHLVALLSPQLPPLLVPCSPGPSKQAPTTSHPSCEVLDIVSKVDLFAGEDGGLEEKIENQSFAKKICVSKQYLASLVLQSKHQKSLSLESSNVIHKRSLEVQKQRSELCWRNKRENTEVQSSARQNFVFRNNLTISGQILNA